MMEGTTMTIKELVAKLLEHPNQDAQVLLSMVTRSGDALCAVETARVHRFDDVPETVWIEALVED